MCFGWNFAHTSFSNDEKNGQSRYVFFSRYILRLSDWISYPAFSHMTRHYLFVRKRRNYFFFENCIYVLFDRWRRYIDRPSWDEVSCSESITLASVFLDLSPFSIFCGVKNFNLGHNFFDTKAKSMKLHTLVYHHKGYNLTKGHNSLMIFDRIMPLYGLEKL